MKFDVCIFFYLPFFSPLEKIIMPNVCNGKESGIGNMSNSSDSPRKDQPLISVIFFPNPFTNPKVLELDVKLISFHLLGRLVHGQINLKQGYDKMKREWKAINLRFAFEQIGNDYLFSKFA